jgi:DNA-directed RNA polymerase specialized sigma subunit
VELKQEIIRVIKMVENPEYRILLELRYLCFKEWRDIADELGYSIRHIYRMREEALEKIIVPT